MPSTWNMRKNSDNTTAWHYWFSERRIHQTGVSSTQRVRNADHLYSCGFIFMDVSMLPSREELWSIHMHDTVLDLTCREEEDYNIVFAALADGTIAVMEVNIETSLCAWNYRQTSNIRHTLEGNKTVDHSDVVGASPADVAPTTSSLST